ncbi:MAG: DnaB-like helicase C-terminal domain-containing protein [Salinivirgaceae bacterium]|nr:DnaB-like helicase C-terminal domain-containing protein [Salinivirgaceae bacterium]
MTVKLLSKVQKASISREQGVMSGIETLDKITGGFHNSNLVVLAGRPAMGCRSFALTCAYNQACAGKKVAFFSVTLSETEIFDRLQNISSILGKGNSEHQFENQIFVNCNHGFEINELRYEIARLKQIENIDIVYIDNLLDISNVGTGCCNKITAAVVTEKLQQLSRDMDIPVVALSSLTRSCESPQREGHYPNMFDLRFENVVNYYTDIVLLLHRYEYYGISVDEDGNPTKGITNLFVEKNPNGNIDIVKFHFEHTETQWGAFCDIK